MWSQIPVAINSIHCKNVEDDSDGTNGIGIVQTYVSEYAVKRCSRGSVPLRLGDPSAASSRESTISHLALLVRAPNEEALLLTVFTGFCMLFAPLSLLFARRRSVRGLYTLQNSPYSSSIDHTMLFGVADTVKTLNSSAG